MDSLFKKIRMLDVSLFLFFFTIYISIISKILIAEYLSFSSETMNVVQLLISMFSIIFGFLIYIISREISCTHKNLYQFLYNNNNSLYKKLNNYFLLPKNKQELEFIFKKDKAFWTVPIGETLVYRTKIITEGNNYLLRLKITTFLFFERIKEVEIKTNTNNAQNEERSTGKHLSEKEAKEVLNKFLK